jgi:hypothetical protein
LGASTGETNPPHHRLGCVGISSPYRLEPFPFDISRERISLVQLAGRLGAMGTGRGNFVPDRAAVHVLTIVADL